MAVFPKKIKDWLDGDEVAPYPVEMHAQPCPIPGCGYPDAGEHDCPGLASFSSNVRLLPVGERMPPRPPDPVGPGDALGAKQMAFLSLRVEMETFMLSAAAWRNHGDLAMRDAADAALKRAEDAWQTLWSER